MRTKVSRDVDAHDRRSFVSKFGLAGLAGVTLVSGRERRDTTSRDTDLLSFALNLEYLQAEFYTMATVGKTIDQLGVDVDGGGAKGKTRGGGPVVLNKVGLTREVAEEIAADERSHVMLLRSTLRRMGATPAAKPDIDLDAEGVWYPGSTAFLQIGHHLEELAVSAYTKMAASVNDKAAAELITRLLAREAGHSANIRLQLARMDPAALPETGVNGKRFFSGDRNALAHVRSLEQVVAASCGGRASGGGFFPKGLNVTNIA